MDSLLAVLVATTVLLPASTGGVLVADTDVPVEGEGAVELTPSPGTNGELYASVVDGKLVLHLDRLSDDAVTRVDHVFTITARGDQAVVVWIEHDAEATTFYRGTNPSNALDDGSRVRLEPGETVAVGVFTDSRERDAELSEITVHAAFPTATREEPRRDTVTPTHVRVTSMSVLPDHLVAGENATVFVTVENVGDVRAEMTVELLVDGISVDQRVLSLDQRETMVITFERTFQRPGTFTVRVGPHARTVIVEPPEEPAPLFAVTDVIVQPRTVQTGESVSISASIQNDGAVSGTFTAELSTGGVVTSTSSVFVPAGEATTVTFTRPFETAGVRSVAVSGVGGGSVTVRSPGPLLPRALIPSKTQAVGLSLTVLAVFLAWRRDLREQLVEYARSKL